MDLDRADHSIGPGEGGAVADGGVGEERGLGGVDFAFVAECEDFDRKPFYITLFNFIRDPLAPEPAVLGIAAAARIGVETPAGGERNEEHQQAARSPIHARQSSGARHGRDR